MASISSLSGSSSSSSIYGNRNYNIISGLASGLDTEELISGLVQSYQQKIQSLQNKNTKYQWQQEGIQSISDKLVEFNRNYASFVYSNTNLASTSFFNNSVITTTNGKYANLVTASGKSSSTISLDAVKMLASAARYTHSAEGLNPYYVGNQNGKITVTSDTMSDLAGNETFSTLAGSLTLNYGDTSVSIDFGELELFAKEDGSFDSSAFKAAIEEKLSKQQITTSSGSSVNADTKIGVVVDDFGRVSFYDKSGAGNSVSIDEATGSLKGMIKDLDSVVDSEAGTFVLDLGEKNTGVTTEKSVAEYLKDKKITVSLDGKSTTIDLSKLMVASGADQKVTAKDFQENLQAELDKVFGTDRITVAKDGSNQLSFTVGEGSALSVTASNSDVGSILGIDSGLTSYLDTSKTLEDLKIGDDFWNNNIAKGVGQAHEQKNEKGDIIGYVDDAGNAVDKDNNRIDESGNFLYDLEINGVKIGSYTKDTELNTIINNINGNTEAGVNVNYSKTTGQFVFTAKDTGKSGRVDIAGGLGAQLFGATVDTDGNRIQALVNDKSYTNGQDAEVVATINGQTMTLTRSSNSFDIDGMNVTINGLFNDKATDEELKAMADSDKVTFTSKTDADTIVDAVKKMVEDLNTIIKEVKNAYSTMPLQKNDGSSYEPLSDEDMADMSDSAIEAYEEKAKTGILFMDSDLSSLYNDLRNAISSSGADGVTLRSMGINTSYSDGLTTITFDEKAFREALESDPDKVQEAFTKSKENGAATNGLMASLTEITEKYASTSGAVKGILIEKAGSKYSPTAALDNTILNQMKDVEEEISKWQDKMSDQVDYYTNKFTQLEMLMNQMNSQSSALAGLMGG